MGDNCIIGTNVVLYRGAKIGKKVLIADLSSVRENVEVGDFTIIGRGVTVENFCKIGSYCKLETNVYITAYSEVEDRVFVAPCVATSNDNYIGRTEERFKHFKGVTIKKGARIGVGAVILPGKVVSEDALVAAGAVTDQGCQSQKDRGRSARQRVPRCAHRAAFRKSELVRGLVMKVPLLDLKKTISRDKRRNRYLYSESSGSRHVCHGAGGQRA